MLFRMGTLDLPQDVFLDIFDAAPIRDLEPGEVIISAGEPATQVFNIQSGVLRVTRTGTDGRRRGVPAVRRGHASERAGSGTRTQARSSSPCVGPNGPRKLRTESDSRDRSTMASP